MSNDDIQTLKSAYALLVEQSSWLSQKMRESKTQLHELQIKERTAENSIQEAKSQLQESSVRQHLDDVRGHLAYHENEYTMRRMERAPWLLACEALKEVIEIQIETGHD